MVTALVGDIFKSKAQTLVNTVNTVGVMGKGIALEFRKRFPEMYQDYVRKCAARQVRLGVPYLFRRQSPPWILNFPTKDHWRSTANLADVIAGLEYLEKHYREWGITSLAVPPLGCGQGQLEWHVVGPVLYRYLNRLNIPVELYAPHTATSVETQLSFLESTDLAHHDLLEQELRINPAWVALVEIVDRIERESYHWPVGRTMFQKIAYFTTNLGLPTGLQYIRGSYGPFTSELKPITTKLINNGILKEVMLGRMFCVKPGPTYESATRLFHTELEQWDEIIERVTDLFLRLTTHQAEIAATVHFAADSLKSNGESVPSEIDVLHEVKRWKQRRRPPIQENEIATSIRNLNIICWLNLRPSPELPVIEDVLVYA